MKDWLISKKLRALSSAVGTASRRAANRSDLQRWSDAANLSAEWDARTIAIAKLIPDHSKVLEFGAGRLVLPKHLQPNCSYTPSDICDRGPGTLICDLNNRPLPPIPFHDVVVFSGVLEYVHNVPEMIDHISSSCRLIIASYVTASQKQLSEQLRRRGAGWVNDYTGEEFVEVFGHAGFRMIREAHFSGSQNIYCFQRIEVTLTNKPQGA